MWCGRRENQCYYFFSLHISVRRFVSVDTLLEEELVNVLTLRLSLSIYSLASQ